jgi:hypothetical protein
MQAAPAKVGVSRIASRQTINFVVAPTPSVHTDPARCLPWRRPRPGSSAWFRFKDAAWRRALQSGLQPVTAGLITASAALLITSTTVDWTAGIVTAVATALFLFAKPHPMLILASAAVAGPSAWWDNDAGENDAWEQPVG